MITKINVLIFAPGREPEAFQNMPIDFLWDIPKGTIIFDSTRKQWWTYGGIAASYILALEEVPNEYRLRALLED